MMTNRKTIKNKNMSYSDIINQINSHGFYETMTATSRVCNMKK